MEARAVRGDAVLEGRLAAFMADRAGIPALRVFLAASEAVRATRIREREGGAAAERLREVQVREASDHRRYLDLYGVDYNDLARYDLVMETERGRPEQFAQAIGERARARSANDDRGPSAPSATKSGPPPPPRPSTWSSVRTPSRRRFIAASAGSRASRTSRTRCRSPGSSRT